MLRHRLYSPRLPLHRSVAVTPFGSRPPSTRHQRLLGPRGEVRTATSSLATWHLAFTSYRKRYLKSLSMNSLAGRRTDRMAHSTVWMSWASPEARSASVTLVSSVAKGMHMTSTCAGRGRLQFRMRLPTPLLASSSRSRRQFGRRPVPTLSSWCVPGCLQMVIRAISLCQNRRGRGACACMCRASSRHSSGVGGLGLWAMFHCHGVL
mmetsp:Transcript_12544/g.35538  ORF Transcript_12544/g.35538 Transcript_12544/m.35538 type:complete len:207 (+) Transcript_12544:400-1020(+)